MTIAPAPRPGFLLLAAFILCGTVERMSIFSDLSSALRRRPRRGFSLVEITIVVVVLGVLAAIAIASFSSQRDDVADIEAQQSLLAVRSEARSLSPSGPTPSGSGVTVPLGEVRFAFKDPAAWPPIPPYTIVTGDASDDPDVVSAALRDAPADKQLVLASYAPLTETCWALLDSLDEGVFFGASKSESCDATTFPLELLSADSFRQVTVAD